MQGKLITFTDEQKKMLKSILPPSIKNSELEVFIYNCERTGLDPFARQIYAIMRKPRKDAKEEVMTIQTAIDGFRIIAERSNAYAGQGKPRFVYTEDSVTGKKLLDYCEIDIYKFNAVNGERYIACVGFAYWGEVAQNTTMWSSMPHNQLAKCAEANGLRKGFPMDLSGIYISEEIRAGDSIETPAPAAPAQGDDTGEYIAKMITDIDKCDSREELLNLFNSMPQALREDNAIKTFAKSKHDQLTSQVKLFERPSLNDDKANINEASELEY